MSRTRKQLKAEARARKDARLAAADKGVCSDKEEEKWSGKLVIGNGGKEQQKK